MTKSGTVLQESVIPDHKHLLCWKSAFGGLLIALMAFVTLTALGAGVAGFTAENLITHEEGGSGLATGAGLYFGISIVISLFCGSYFALRISRFVTPRVGAAHGFVIASSFFLLMVLGLGNMVGGVASGFAGLAKASGVGVTDLASNPQVQDSFNRAFGTSTLKSGAKEVAQGLAVRLAQGDTESAKNYFAYQTGLSRNEADARVTQAQAEFDAAVKTAAQKTAHGIGDTGLCLFVVFLVGLVSSVIGGRVGAHSNVERPFAVARSTPSIGFPILASERGSVLPYVVGWFLGVPVSILFLIALLRTVF